MFLLQQVSAVIQVVPIKDRVQSNVQFERGGLMPLSVPAFSKAADLDPVALGSALVEATRTASSLTAARNALNELLLPQQPIPVATVEL